MTNINEYRSELADLSSQLESKAQPDGAIFLASTRTRNLTEHRGNIVTPVTKAVAMKMIIRGTHQVASDEQVSDWKRAQEEHIRQHQEQDEENKTINKPARRPVQVRSDAGNKES